MTRVGTALVILALLGSGCAVFKGLGSSPDQLAANGVVAADGLLKDRRYPEAVAAYRKVLLDHPRTPSAANAYYGMAMAFVAADNQQKDYSQALANLDEFISRAPDDPRTPDARNWRHAIKLLLDMKRDNDRLNKNIEKLKQLDMKQEEKRQRR